LGYHKKAGKTRPFQTLFWHCFNTYHAIRTMEDVLPEPLTLQESKILRLAALFHDTGKVQDCWQEKGSGPHTPSDAETEMLEAALQNSALMGDFLPDESERAAIIQLIREHHTRKTVSSCDVDRLMTLLKTCDTLVSSTSISHTQVERIRELLQPTWVPLVLTAEEHPVSYYLLSACDVQAVEEGAKLLVTNPLQSLYLVPRKVDRGKFKVSVENAAAGLLEERMAASGYYVSIDTRSSKRPVTDEARFRRDLHNPGISSPLEEMLDVIRRRRKRLEADDAKGRNVNWDQLWYGPAKLLLWASKSVKSNVVLGTNIHIESVVASRYPTFQESRRLGEELGATNPEDFAEIAIRKLRDHLPPAKETDLDLDVFMWSDQVVDARGLAEAAYNHYKRTQWNSARATSWSRRPLRRSTKAYCFSCKRRPPFDKAPTVPRSYLKIDTWTSSVAKKGPVRVCKLCHVAQAHVLPEREPARFSVQFTPPYNQARVDWPAIMAEGISPNQFDPEWVTSHRVLISLQGASSPSDALAAVFDARRGSARRGGSFRTIGDFLFLNGLTAVVGAGPGHAGEKMISGMGIRISHDQWERFGAVMALLDEFRRREEFPSVSIWRELVGRENAWGTFLAKVHRRHRMTRDRAQEVARVVDKLAAGTSLEQIRDLPLWTHDREERFKSAESIFRRMEEVARQAARRQDEYGSESEIVEIIAQNGKKELRNRVMRARGQKNWPITGSSLCRVEKALRIAAREIWKTRDKALARKHWINAAVMTVAYKSVEEED
jgi:hypothetical protein